MLNNVIGALVLVPIIYLGIAGGLILSQWPSQVTPTQDGLDFSGVTSGERDMVPEPQGIEMRDGHLLPVRTYGDASAGPLVVLVHGSGWHGLQFHKLASSLAETAHIAVPDLRGHGATPISRGDINHIGQFEEDLADVIDQLRQDQQQVIVAGHSSGGGLVVRMAGGEYGNRIDKAVLLSPFLKFNAPTMRPNSGGWSNVLTRRLIGLSMLNTVGISAFNSLKIIQFTMPQSVLDGPLGHTATTAYSYTLNTSFAPRDDYLGDVAMLPPFMLIAGNNDEAFLASEFEPLLSGSTEAGTYHLIDDVGHLDVVDVPQTAQLLSDFIQ